MRIHLIFLMYALFCTCSAQKTHTQWYFGNNAGLNFLTTPPSPMLNSSMYTIEGCSSIADTAGALLFYTNGVTVWNKNHAVMANGTGLQAFTSSTQTSLILKRPGSDSLYYIFTMGIVLGYSVVDLSLAAGQGSVTVKNFTLVNMQVPQTSEKVHGAKHCNGTDYWIVTHPQHGSVFYSFLLSTSGVNSVAVISSVGEDTLGPRGTLKISPNGKKLALIDGYHQQVILHDFDISTGAVSSSSLALESSSRIYSAEFSPDGSKLYTSDGVGFGVDVNQYDLCAGSDAAIKSSKTLLFSQINTPTGGVLQLAPDGKIYRAINDNDSIAVIHNPNAAGLACNYSNSGPSLGGKISQWGLPNFINDAVRIPPTISHTSNCQNVTFTINNQTLSCTATTMSIVSTMWNFGDASSGSNTSTLSNTTHFYSGTGSFTAQLIINYNCTADTIYIPVEIIALSPTIGISGDSTICAGEKTFLIASGQGSIKWSTNQTTNSISVSPATTATYSAIVTGINGCTSSSKFRVLVDECAAIFKNLNAFFRIYPNPVENTLVIETQISNYTILLRDAVGRVIKEERTTGNECKVDVSILPSGIYFIELQSVDQRCTLYFIKQ